MCMLHCFTGSMCNCLYTATYIVNWVWCESHKQCSCASLNMDVIADFPSPSLKPCSFRALSASCSHRLTPFGNCWKTTHQADNNADRCLQTCSSSNKVRNSTTFVMYLWFHVTYISRDNQSTITTGADLELLNGGSTGYAGEGCREAAT